VTNLRRLPFIEESVYELWLRAIENETFFYRYLICAKELRESISRWNQHWPITSQSFCYVVQNGPQIRIADLCCDYRRRNYVSRVSCAITVIRYIYNAATHTHAPETPNNTKTIDVAAKHDCVFSGVSHSHVSKPDIKRVHIMRFLPRYGIRISASMTVSSPH
jgi:hypothetical protein